MAEFRKALSLNRMSATTYGQVARSLIASFPLLEEADMTEAQSVIERAVLLNRRDRELQQLARPALRGTVAERSTE